MASSAEDVERLLAQCSVPFESVSSGTWLVHIATGQAPAVLRLESPVLLLQVDIGAVALADSQQRAAFYQRLLELNATGLLHASYGLEKGHVVLGAALELENLDSNELAAVLADLGLALSEHLPELSTLISTSSQS